METIRSNFHSILFLPKICLNVTLPSRFSKWPFYNEFPTEILHAFLSVPSQLYVPSLFRCLNKIRLPAELNHMFPRCIDSKLILVSFRDPYAFLRTIFLNTCILFRCLRVRDDVSEPYEDRQIISLYSCAVIHCCRLE